MASVSYAYRHQEYLREHQEFLDRLEASRLRIQRTQRWHFLTGLFVSPFYKLFEQPYSILKHVYSSVLRIFQARFLVSCQCPVSVLLRKNSVKDKWQFFTLSRMYIERFSGTKIGFLARFYVFKNIVNMGLKMHVKCM